MGFFSAALATGALGASGGVEPIAGVALAMGAAGFAFSCSQRTRHRARAAAPNVAVILRRLDIVTSSGRLRTSGS